ncbi:iron chelate uptake ABC transporter family permease subunit [Staphylococcus aureus]
MMYLTHHLINVRLPRLLEALLTGMILTVAGLIFQTVLNNALADSFTLGLERRYIWFRISIIFRFNNVMDSCIFNNI